MIIKNAIRCSPCGDEIESKHRYDYVECKCGAATLMVDMITRGGASKSTDASQRFW